MSEDKPRKYRCLRCLTPVHKYEKCPTCHPDWKPDQASFNAGCDWQRTIGDTFQSQLAAHLGIPQENVTVDNVVALVETLRKAQQGINDWVCTYADDMVGEEELQAARDRIFLGGGTLAYAADINASCRSSLAPFTIKEGKHEHD